MKSALSLCSVALLSFTLSGCVFIDGEYVGREDWREEQRDNRDKISQLQMGTAVAEVIDRLGTPAQSEAFNRGEEEIRVLFYRTQWKHSDGETSRDETTPLVFENGMLVGWGDTAYASARR